VTEQETTATGKDIGQVLHGPFCGRFVPDPDELDETLAELGIERTAEHPEFAMEPDEGFAEEDFELEGAELEGAEFESMVTLQGMGRKLALPSGTPRNFPPFAGATRLWSERSRDQVLRIRRKAPGIVCATYRHHGRTGMPWGIDIFVSQIHHMADNRQKRLGNALVRWLENNWSEMHINYIIWFNQMKDSGQGGWFSYEPWVGLFGDPNPVTQRHQDHVHVQVMNPNRGPRQ
jgi:hypothetical protein